MSVRLRLTLWYVAVLCLGLSLFGAAVLWQTDRAADTSLDQTLTRRAHDVAADLRPGRPLTLQHDAPTEGQPGDAALWVRVLDAHGRLLVQQGPAVGDVPRRLLGAAQPGVSTADLGPGRHVRLVIVSVRRGGRRVATVQVLMTTAALDAAWDRLVAAMSVAGGLTVLIAAVGGLVLADRTLTPVDRITRLAAGIGAGDLHRRVGDAVGGSGRRQTDELGRLVSTFDGMLARLEDAVAARRRLTADVAHELGTPIATIVSTAEIALRRPRRPDEYRTVLQQVVAEGQHMGRLVDDLLLLARVDAGRLPLEQEIVELDEVCRQAVRAYAPLAQERDIALRARWPREALLVVGDEGRLGQVVRNLLDNALRYTPSGGAVIVTLEGEATHPDASERVVLRVRDTGPGIDPRERERVFDRFHRAETEPPGEGRRVGSGLGLAICQAIVLAHGGQIGVADSMLPATGTPGRGTELIVTFPRLSGDAG